MKRKRTPESRIPDPGSRSLLISGARLLDPASGFDGAGHLGVRDGRITWLGKTAPKEKYDERLDAKDLWLMPGAVDLCARLREPGQTHKATIRSEARAAAAGGITTVCLPPDTQPVIDTPAIVDRIYNRAREVGGVDIQILGALTRGLAGDTLAEMGALKSAGCAGVSNAQMPLQDTRITRRALQYAHTHGLTVHVNPVDAALAGDGCAHEGAVATRLGLPGIPASAETVSIAQWLALVAETGARVHFGRLSTARGAELIAQAQARRLPVTADVAAHQLFLTEADVDGFDSACRVLPPLRTAADREALRRALRRGTLAALCSDHQPHEADAKINPFPLAAPGISALESLLPLTLRLVHEKALTPLQAVACLTSNPAKILGIDAGRLTPGAPAHLTLIDPGRRWTLEADQLRSAGHSTPFAGRVFHGQVVATWHSGRQVFGR
jgi:dihydroorotase